VDDASAVELKARRAEAARAVAPIASPANSKAELKR
jgi:hypothetical protein